jgi:ankyrin repeat protein
MSRIVESSSKTSFPPCPKTESPAPAEPPAPQFSVEDFFQAVRYGATSHIEFILDNDPSLVNKLDSEGFTSIHWAAKRGDYEVLSELHKRGADLDTAASFDSQMRPIHWAASDGKLRSVKFLLEHRQDINALDANSCTPLIIAAQYGRVETVVYLVCVYE